MGGCSKLELLPERFGELHLTEIDFSGCTAPDLGVIFDVIFKFEGLTKLGLADLEMESLPERFGQLRSLVTLDLSWCKQLLALPEGIPPRILPLSAALAMLAQIDRDISASILPNRSLSEGFGQLRNLQTLSLCDCRRLRALPAGFGQLRSLVKLDLSYSGVKELSAGFGDLKSLK